MIATEVCTASRTATTPRNWQGIKQSRNPNVHILYLAYYFLLEFMKIYLINK